MTETTPDQTVVMTGATSGIGRHAVEQIAAQPDTKVIIGARGRGRDVPEDSAVIPLDLASLDSVRSFADTVKQRLGDNRIDMLLLNAGVLSSNANQRSDDGFEKMFAVNHLGHYLLARELLPYLAESARLVITTSETHDPEQVPFAPEELDIQAIAQPREGRSNFGAYAASKLCNLLTARAFADLDEVKARKIRVIAYTPSLTPDTSLGDDGSLLQGTLSRLMATSPGRLVLRFASRFNPDFYPGTAERGGEALAQLALGEVSPPDDQIYVGLVKGEITFLEPSELSQSDEARDRLWRESSKMVDLNSG